MNHLTTPKCVACASWTDSPSTSVIRITPKQIAHGSFMRDFLNSIEGSDIVEGIDAGRESSVEAEDLVFDKSCEWEVVE